MIRFSTVFLLLLAMAINGCSVLPETQEISLYQLPDSTLESSAEPRADWSLRVKTPKASDAQSGSRMLVMARDNELAALPGARWVSPTPRLWQDHLVRAFTADSRVPAITTDRDNLLADRELSGVLRAFQVDFSGESPQAVIRFDAVFADTPSRTIIASRSFEVREPVSGRTPAAMVTALGAAADKVSGELMNWMLTLDSKP